MARRGIAYTAWFQIVGAFNDGLEGTVSMSGLIHSARAGVFAALQDEDLFSRASSQHGGVTWPGELDLAPDAMYEAIRHAGEWVFN
jgi:hypothetical protein